MKRLLYTGAALSIISIFTYFNLTNIANWWVAKKDVQEQQELVKNQGKDTLPYFKNQFIVKMPANQDSAKRWNSYLTSLGLRRSDTCACSDSLILWTASSALAEILVDLQPDHEQPPPMGIMMRKLQKDSKDTLPNKKAETESKVNFNPNGYISKNYKLVEPITYQKVIRPLDQNLKRFAKVERDAPKVIVATIDSGVDPSVPGVASSLFRNSAPSTICRPPTIEGIYGWNTLNTAHILSDIEPIDKDEKCYGFFSVRRGHGTLINGIIAGMGSYPNQTDFTNNTNVNIQLLNVRFVDQRTNKGSLFHAICGINYALDKGAKVINISWRLPVIGVDEASVKATFLSTLIHLRDANAMMVACAGNNQINDPNLKIWPAAFSHVNSFGYNFTNNVIAVGGWDTNSTINAIANTSNVANFVDIYAPSVDIRMYNRIPPVNWWQNLFIFDIADDGTSFATPFISREVAILMANPANMPAFIKNQIISPSSMPTFAHIVPPVI